MKISKDRLKQIIKEELAAEEVGMTHPEHAAGAEDAESYPVDPDGYEGRMAKTNLWKIAEYAQEMHDLIHDDENLEPWVEEKIAVAAYMMDQIGHHLQYMKQRAGEEMEHEPEHGDDEEYDLVVGDFEDEEQEEKMCEDC
jgi:hypothetical protein